MNLSFAPNEEDDILNTTIEDPGTGLVAYTVDTPKYAKGTLTTTVTRRNEADGSARLAFKILWRGSKGPLSEDVMVVLDSTTLEEVPVRQVLEDVPGASTYGSVRIDDVEYRWKPKGTGIKVVLIDKNTRKTVAKSHSRIQSSFFKKPRDMSLEVSETISHALDIVLLTFILVWRQRRSERSQSMKTMRNVSMNDSTLPLAVGDGLRY